jgi:SAM-dependent methyltransferase
MSERQPSVEILQSTPWQMVPGERAALEGVLAQLRPRLAIEIGTAQGGSLQRIAAYADEVHSFDLVAPSLELPDNVTLHTGDSHALLPAFLAELAAAGRRVDFVLVDGDHSAEGARADLEDVLDSPAVSRTMILAHDAGNDLVRAGLEAVAYERWPKVSFVDLEWIPGWLGRGEPWHHELWGGFALIVVDETGPYPLAPEVTIGRYPTGAVLAHLQAEVDDAAPPALEPTSEVLELARRVGDDWRTSAYHEEAEAYIEPLWRDVVWPTIADCDFRRVVDLAAGHGPNTRKLLEVADEVWAVDMNQENLDACRARFGDEPRLRCALTDGSSLAALDDESVSLVYCFGAMVHFDSDVVRAYLGEFRRVLVPGGHAFCRHSNYTRSPGGDVHDNPHWRNFMSRELFAHYAAKEGLEVVHSRVIDWSEAQGLDGLTLLRRPSSTRRRRRYPPPMPDPETQELQLDQLRRERGERAAAEEAAEPDEAHQHARRADRAAYLRDRLEERARSEDEAEG